IAGAVGLAIVLALALPALSMNTGQPRANSLGGTGQPAKTLHALERQGVPSAVVFPIQVLTHGGPAAAQQAAAIAHPTPGVYGVPATGSIGNWIPLVTFAFLFGLSMDYEVFILARMREEYDNTHSTNEAVV